MNIHEAVRYAHRLAASALRAEVDRLADYGARTPDEWEAGPDAPKIRRALTKMAELHDRHQPMRDDRAPRVPEYKGEKLPLEEPHADAPTETRHDDADTAGAAPAGANDSAPVGRAAVDRVADDSPLCDGPLRLTLADDADLHPETDATGWREPDDAAADMQTARDVITSTTGFRPNVADIALVTVDAMSPTLGHQLRTDFPGIDEQTFIRFGGADQEPVVLDCEGEPITREQWAAAAAQARADDDIDFALQPLDARAHAGDGDSAQREASPRADRKVCTARRTDNHGVWRACCLDDGHAGDHVLMQRADAQQASQ